MLDTHTIELAMPAGMTIDTLDVNKMSQEEMKGLLEAVFSCNAEDRQAGEGVMSSLAGNGWTVRQGLTWVASANRGDHSERVSAPSRCEAVARLREYTLLHDAEGCP